jgi:hypothetical protein
LFHIVLQVWGGMLSLLNKIYFSRAERSEGDTKQRWRAWAWAAEIVASPAWLAIFFLEKNWIAIGLEVGNAPSLIMGLIAALHGVEKTPRWLTWVAGSATLGGILYSLRGGMTTASQVFETGMAIGLLAGTFLLAKQKPTGYLCFMLMNASTAALMGIEGYWLLVPQQIVCLGFVVDAYLSEKRIRRARSTHP